MAGSAAQGATSSSLVVSALRRFGDRTAFVQDDREYTYEQAADLLNRMVAVLTSTGYDGATGIGTLSPNRAEVWLAQVAAGIAGGRYTGLHPLGSLDDHVFTCDDADLSILVVDPRFAALAAEVAARVGSVKQIFTLGPSPVGSDLLAVCADVGALGPLSPGPATEADPCWLVYTGGTTGRPKGVVLPHRSVVQAVYATGLSWQVPTTPRYLAVSPITHAAAIPITPTLLRGGTVVLHEAFDPSRWLATVAAERINLAFAVPTMVYALLDHGVPEAADLSTLETVVYGASPIAPTRLAEAHERIGNVFVQIYGQSECTGMGTSLLREEHDPVRWPERLASCGRPVVGTELRIVDDDGIDVADGEIGEICIRSRAVMDGYLNEPALTEEALADGWLHTSDVARRDEQGYVYLVDRKKDMVISGGFNVYPREVEDVLAAHPAVAQSAVIGIPDDRWGEAVTAIVVVRPGASVDAAEIQALVRERKGPHQAPKHVEFVEALPMTPVGKVDKKVLRARYWAAQDRNVH